MKERDFKSHFGVDPTVYMMIYNLLENGNEFDPQPEIVLQHDHLLYALDFLKRYETESRMATRYGKLEKTLRKWIWIYVKK